VRTRATRGTINRSTLLLLECKINSGSHAKRLSATGVLGATSGLRPWSTPGLTEPRGGQGSIYSSALLGRLQCSPPSQLEWCDGRELHPGTGAWSLALLVLLVRLASPTNPLSRTEARREGEGPAKKIDGPPVHFLNPRSTYLPADFFLVRIVGVFAKSPCPYQKPFTTAPPQFFCFFLFSSVYQRRGIKTPQNQRIIF
jgi:hypothetical protein